ncbi:alpha/beta hydrolase [Frateuria sp. GZRR33]|uniref:alpha/beta hydrolase n=1 Tax=Frateuria sp. GZRR33 TaxID=3351535 RepID=UPI003EDBBCB6
MHLGSSSWRRLPGHLAFLIGACLLGGCQTLFFGGLNAVTGARGVQATRGVVFDPARGLALDVYRPPGASGAPVVVFFYGGNWKSGQRQWYRWVGETLARHGVVAVIPDYRKWPGARLDGFMHDAARAVAWTRTHAQRFGADPRALFVMGHSAGAHIGALLATDARWLGAEGMLPRDLRGFIGLAGPYDFLPLTDPDFVDMFGDTRTAQLRSQPVHFVTGDEPPMLLLQGGADDIVASRNASSLGQALRRHGEPVTLELYPDVGHAGILLALAQPFRSKAPVLVDLLAFVRAEAPVQPLAVPTAE